MKSVVRQTKTPSETRRLGERIGKMLRAGDVVLLSGELGAGKTVLAQGIGRGLGVVDPIKSSSFVIMNEYDGRELRLFHADLYRLEDRQQVAELALDELASRGVLVVEWPERAEAEMPPVHLRVTLAYDGAKGRAVEIEGRGARYEEIGRRLGARRAGKSATSPTPSAICDLVARSDASIGTLEAPTVLSDAFSNFRVARWGGDEKGRLSEYGSLAVVGDRAVIHTYFDPPTDPRRHLMLGELEATARQHLKEGWLRIEHTLAPTTPVLPSDVTVVYDALGYSFFYTEAEMHRDLRETIAGPTHDELVAWTRERDLQIREAYNESFRSRGFDGYDEQEWVGASFSAQDSFRQDLSFLALDGDQITGFCLSVIDEANARTALIDTLGVRPAYRGRGIATALIARSMAAMREAGFECAALRVNEDNAPARRLYEKFGFETVKKHVVYRKRL